MKRFYLLAAFLLIVGMNCMADDMLTTISKEHDYSFKTWTVYDVQKNEIQQWELTNKEELNGYTWLNLSKAVYKKDGRYNEPPSGYLYRQEGDKVFRYSETEQKEVLLFDYSLSLGAQFTDENGRQMEVVAVSDTVFIQYFEENAPSHRCLTLRATDGSGDEDRWIEGIGSLSQGVFGNALQPSDNRSQLMYCETWLASVCFPVYSKDFKAVRYTKVQTNDKEESACYELLPDGTLHITGSWYLICCGTPYLTCRTEEDIIQIKDNTVGEMCTCMAVHEVDIRIPGFSAGNYTVYLGNRAIPSKQELLSISTQTIGEDFKFMNGTLYSLTEIPLTLSIYTMDGMNMYGDKVDGGMSLNLNFLPGGTYCYQIEIQGKVYSGKFMITGQK